MHFNFNFLINKVDELGSRQETVSDPPKLYLSALLRRTSQHLLKDFLHLVIRNHQKGQRETSRHGGPLRPQKKRGAFPELLDLQRIILFNTRY